MAAHAENPFQDRVDSQNNACIDNFMQFSQLGTNYMRSADALIDAAVLDNSLLDVHVYSVCFLYRHGIELILKDLLWKSNFVTRGTKEFPKIHNLGKLWENVHANINDLLSADFPFTAIEIAQIKEFLTQLEKHDQCSYAFRYPFNKDVQRTHPKLVHVNVRALHEAVHQTVEHLQTLGELVLWHFDQKADYKADQTNADDRDESRH